jgi:YD repeat-containing protein
VVPWTPVVSSLTYEPFAAVNAVALGNGLAVSNDWGNDGHLAARRLYRSFDNTSLSYLAYRYDGDDNIAAIADQLGPGGTQLYGYDQLDRLNFTLLQPGSTAGTTSYSYTPETNRLASLSDASGARSITYDARGNTASELRPGGITAATGYGASATDVKAPNTPAQRKLRPRRGLELAEMCERNAGPTSARPATECRQAPARADEKCRTDAEGAEQVLRSRRRTQVAVPPFVDRLDRYCSLGRTGVP